MLFTPTQKKLMKKMEVLIEKRKTEREIERLNPQPILTPYKRELLEKKNKLKEKITKLWATKNDIMKAVNEYYYTPYKIWTAYKHIWFEWKWRTIVDLEVIRSEPEPLIYIKAYKDDTRKNELFKVLRFKCIAWIIPSNKK